MTFCQPRYDRCDDCGEDSDTGAICRACIDDRIEDEAHDRRGDA